MSKLSAVITGSNNKLTDIGTSYPIGAERTLMVSDNLANMNLLSGVVNNMSNVSVVRLGKSMTEIPEYSYYKCTSMHTFIGNAACQKIGSTAFFRCTSLKQLPFLAYPKISIGSHAFEECTSLETAIVNLSTINNQTPYIGPLAFAGCTSLRSVDMRETETISQQMFWNCSHLSSVQADHVQLVDEKAFLNCGALSSIELPSIKQIKQRTFESCTYLNDIKFGNGLTSIGDYSFKSCNALTSLNLSSTGISIVQSNMLNGASSLKVIRLPTSANTPSSFSANCFASQTNLSVYLPGVVDSYFNEHKQEYTNFGSATSVTYIINSNIQYQAGQNGVQTRNVGNTAFIICINTSNTSFRRFHDAFVLRDILNLLFNDSEFSLGQNVYWVFDVQTSQGYNKTKINVDTEFKNRKEPTYTNLLAVFDDVIAKHYKNIVYIFEDHGSNTLKMCTQQKYVAPQDIYDRLYQLPSDGRFVCINASCYSGGIGNNLPDDLRSRDYLFIAASSSTTTSTRGPVYCYYCPDPTGRGSNMHESNRLIKSIVRVLGFPIDKTARDNQIKPDASYNVPTYYDFVEGLRKIYNQTTIRAYGNFRGSTKTQINNTPGSIGLAKLFTFETE